MCEQLRSEPIPEEIPVDYSDLPEDCHNAIALYNILPDKFDGFAGIYFGKDFSGVGDIMDAINISDKYHTFLFLNIMIDVSKKQFADAQKRSNK